MSDILEETKKSVIVAERKEVALVPIGMNVKTFNKFVQRHDLTPDQSLQIIEMQEVHKASVPYIGMMLRNGSTFHHVSVAYVLRDELGTLHDADSSKHGRSADFQLPIDKGCMFLNLLQKGNGDSDNEETQAGDFEDEDIEAIVRLLCEVADRTPTVLSWSKIIDMVLESLDLLESVSSDQGFVLSYSEKIEVWLEFIDKHEIFKDRRFSM